MKPRDFVLKNKTNNNQNSYGYKKYSIQIGGKKFTEYAAGLRLENYLQKLIFLLKVTFLYIFYTEHQREECFSLLLLSC